MRICSEPFQLTTRRRFVLGELANRIEAIENRPAFIDSGAGDQSQPMLDTGWHDEHDFAKSSPIAALPWSAVHEWFAATTGTDTKARSRWFPPMSLFLHLALQALRSDRAAFGQCIVWIGRACWWCPRARLASSPPITRALFYRSIFVDPSDDAQRLWAIDLALRCPGVLLVVADGRRMRMPDSRRLQLAAASGCAMALLARPPHEASHLSAARTRWCITPLPAPLHTDDPRWTVQLLRYKGMQPTSRQDAPTQWTVQRNHETGAVNLFSDVAHRSASPARPEIIRPAERIA